MWTLDHPKEAEYIQELTNSSDRAAAIIAHALVDTRLKATIKAALRQDKTIQDELFETGKGLESFYDRSTLGYLMSLYNKDALNDLRCLNSIRNRFAHYLEFSSFDDQAIRDKCKNLKLIERCVLEPGIKTPAHTTGLFHNEIGDLLIIEIGANELLKRPKQRFLLTAKLFSYALSEWPRIGMPRPNI